MMPLTCIIRNFDVIIHILLMSNILKSYFVQSNMLLLSKTQEEYNFTAFKRMFGIHVNVTLSV